MRDLIDVQALVESGEDLDSALAAAPRRDSGFSPLTLGWVLRDLDVNGLAGSLGFGDDVAERLDAFRRSLVERLVTPS